MWVHEESNMKLKPVTEENDVRGRGGREGSSTFKGGFRENVERVEEEEAELGGKEREEEEEEKKKKKKKIN